MNAFPTRLERHLWAAFLTQQAGIFLLALVFLSSVRRITGRTIHLGRDPIGLGDGAALIVLSIAVILLTRLFYLWIKGENATPLGIALSPRRFLDLIIGTLTGFTFAITPWANALLRGTASIYDRITSHFDSFTVARILTVAFCLLLLQSIMEETANRAFPMRLWEHRSLAFRLIVPSIFFAALHLADEQFSLERVSILLMAGIVQSIAYALTGNIWLTSGVHTGANLATFSISGLWHAGAILSVRGQPTIPNWVTVMLMLVLFSALFAWRRRYGERPAAPVTPGAG
jgi:membrane protease YdiL (CAAX protease family)